MTLQPEESARKVDSHSKKRGLWVFLVGVLNWSCHHGFKWD